MNTPPPKPPKEFVLQPQRPWRDGGCASNASAPPPANLVPYIPLPQAGILFDGSYAGVTGQPPPHLNRSALALWWTIKDLIDHDRCYFWTVTAINRVPDSWFGNMHSMFMKHMRDAARAGKLPRGWGGVRVFEPHPGGHGLHSHLVLKCRMNVNVVRECAKRAGLGRVHVSPKPVTMGMGHYLCKYLMKGSEMAGVRRWACVGNHDGVMKNDIVFSGTRAKRIKELAAQYRFAGMHRYAAFLKACQQYEIEKREAMHET